MDNTEYFYRTVVFTRANDQIALADIDQPEKITPLDEWLGIVISLADGNHSILELIDYLRQRYQVPPANLEDTLHSAIERLMDGKLIRLSKTTVTLPYYLASPIEELDIEKAKQLIEEDGHDTTADQS
ncbi:MAG: hypothetical protein V7711_17470 [Pseudomonadales bacterium]